MTDAKTAAVVGAALHQDILNGNLKGFSLKEEPHLERTPHYWGGINQNARPEEFFKNLIFDKRKLDGNRETFAECEMPIGSVLGRKSSSMLKVILSQYINFITRMKQTKWKYRKM